MKVDKSTERVNLFIPVLSLAFCRKILLKPGRYINLNPKLLSFLIAMELENPTDTPLFQVL